LSIYKSSSKRELIESVNALVKKSCCNYDNGNCLLLDDRETCVCPQLISYSLLCKWFRAAVPYAARPLRPALTAPNTALIAGSVSPGKQAEKELDLQGLQRVKIP